jgi:NADPH-dependent ferric siderophore reductase
MGLLTCEARVRTELPSRWIAALCAQFTEDEAHSSWTETRGEAEFRFGTGRIEADAEMLHLRAEAADAASLAKVKFLLATRLEDIAAAEKPEIVWTGDGCDSNELPNLRVMRVRRVADVTPHMRRITLAGAHLDRFDGSNLHVKLLIPPSGLATPAWPVMGRNGIPIWPEGDERLTVRTYTIRRIDAGAGEIDIDFVRHEDAGPGAAWAERAQAGDIVGIMGPGGRGIAPAEWYLLAGDETALPAIGRMLETLSADARGIALVEVADAGEEQAIAHPPGLSLVWLPRDGAAPGTTTSLVEAVRGVEWPDTDNVFAWAGAEFEAFRAIRTHWRRERGLDRHRHLAVAYWRRGHCEGEFKKTPAED